MARKTVKKDEDELWASVAKTVTPLEKRTRLSTSPARKSAQKNVGRPAKNKTATPKQLSAAQPQQQRADLLPADLNSIGYGGISRSNARMIKTGQARPTARVDLHGLTRDQAKSRLEKFITTAMAERHRVVLVITGKGVAGQGVIRRNLPYWLTSPPLAAMVIAYCEAQPKDGGGGAYYVNLRQS